MTDNTNTTTTAGASPVECHVMPLVDRLRAAALPGTNRNALDEAAAQEIERLRRALHEIAEEWAGAECGEPVYAQEAYAITLAKRMYALAVEGLTPNARAVAQTTAPQE